MSHSTLSYPVRLRTRPAKRDEDVVAPPQTADHERLPAKNGEDRPTDPRGGEPAADDDGTYQVGYGKPPMHTRFQKGVCPNPKGRPKGAKDMRTRVQEIANEKVPVSSNGRMRMMSKKDIGITKAVNRFAETGDLKGLEMLLRLEGASVAGGGEHAAGRSPQPIEEPNLDLLQWFLDRQRKLSDPDKEG